MKRIYKEEVEKLVKAIDIAIEAVKKYMPEQDLKTQEHFIKSYQMFKEETLNPKPQYRNLKSLDLSKVDVFIYFQEVKGDTVEYFWRRLKEERLDYKRVNKLDKILKRKKIKNQEEYDYVTDAVVPLKQEGVITDKEFEKLSEMLDGYQFGTK